MTVVEYVVTDEDTGEEIEVHTSRSRARSAGIRLKAEGVNVGLRHRHVATDPAPEDLCPTCGASGADPCVTSSGKVTKRHKARDAE